MTAPQLFAVIKQVQQANRAAQLRKEKQQRLLHRAVASKQS
jgi:hypothetical protein